MYVYKHIDGYPDKEREVGLFYHFHSVQERQVYRLWATSFTRKGTAVMTCSMRK